MKLGPKLGFYFIFKNLVDFVVNFENEFWLGWLPVESYKELLASTQMNPRPKLGY